MISTHKYANFDALADDVVAAWMEAIRQERGHAYQGYALAGGMTPEPLYRRFAEKMVQEGNIAPVPLRFVPTDERWVEPNDPQSNERMIRDCLAPVLSGSVNSRLVSLKTGAASVALAIDEVSARMSAAFPGPFSAVILGMGTDAHIASIFPGDAGVNPANPSAPCIAAIHPESGQPRISLSMNRLLDTRRIWLVIKGEEKRALLQRIEGDCSINLPVAELIRRASCAVDVFWCP